MSFDDILAQADILTLHVPLTLLTRGIIHADMLVQMTPGARLINAAHTPVLDLDVLIEALQTGHISSAGIDIFPNEPVPTNHPLLILPSVVVSPYMAAASEPSLARMSLVAEDIARVLLRQVPHYRVVL